jgi:hypothetical protein
MSKIIAVATLMIACGMQMLGAQDQERTPKSVVFHVTSVERVDNSAACKSEMCSGLRYKVEGYVDAEPNATATQYVITCDEFSFDRPHPHRDNICARFHAGNAYTALLQSDRISFPYSGLNKSFETDYSIVSEKEIPRNLDPRDTNGGSEPRQATGTPEKREPAKGPEQLASKNGQ